MSEQHGSREPAQGPAYGFSCELKAQDFAIAVTRVTEALKAEGFGALTDIDVQGATSGAQG